MASKIGVAYECFLHNVIRGGCSSCHPLADKKNGTTMVQTK